jgi:hypothetical protein
MILPEPSSQVLTVRFGLVVGERECSGGTERSQTEAPDECRLPCLGPGRASAEWSASTTEAKFVVLKAEGGKFKCQFYGPPDTGKTEPANLAVGRNLSQTVE